MIALVSCTAPLPISPAHSICFNCFLLAISILISMLGLLPLYFCYALAELRQIVGKPFSPPESAKKNQTTKKKHSKKKNY